MTRINRAAQEYFTREFIQFPRLYAGDTTAEYRKGAQAPDDVDLYEFWAAVQEIEDVRLALEIERMDK